MNNINIINIILIGFKNSGKTSIANFIAKKTGKICIDTDSLIEKKMSSTIKEIYEYKGEEYFRSLEKTVIFSLQNIYNSIIATGGGSILDSDNIVYLKKSGKLIYLDTPLDILLARLQLESTPLFLDANHPEKSFNALYEKRKILYQKAADVTLFTENKSIETISEEIVSLIRHA